MAFALLIKFILLALLMIWCSPLLTVIILFVHFKEVFMDGYRTSILCCNPFLASI